MADEIRYSYKKIDQVQLESKLDDFGEDFSNT